LGLSFQASPFCQWHHCQKTARKILQYDRITESVFKLDGSADRAILEEVTLWLRQSICQHYILEAVDFKLEDVAEVVAWAGARIDNFRSIFHKEELYTLDGCQHRNC